MAALEGVAAAGRALAILAAFRKGDGALSLAELAERTGLVKSTIMRLAITLEEHGFLVRQENGACRLGAELLRLGSVYQAGFRLDAVVLPALQALADRTGESASFYIREGAMRRCLFRVESPQALRVHVRPGDSLPLDNSAIAQVLRHAGTGLLMPVFSQGATDPHTAGLAAPVFGPGEEFRGALAITAPITRLTREAADAAAPLLREAAGTVSAALGGSVPSAVRWT